MPPQKRKTPTSQAPSAKRARSSAFRPITDADLSHVFPPKSRPALLPGEAPDQPSRFSWNRKIGAESDIQQEIIHITEKPKTVLPHPIDTPKLTKDDQLALQPDEFPEQDMREPWQRSLVDREILYGDLKEAEDDEMERLFERAYQRGIGTGPTFIPDGAQPLSPGELLHNAILRYRQTLRHGNAATRRLAKSEVSKLMHQATALLLSKQTPIDDAKKIIAQTAQQTIDETAANDKDNDDEKVTQQLQSELLNIRKEPTAPLDETPPPSPFVPQKFVPQKTKRQEEESQRKTPPQTPRRTPSVPSNAAQQKESPKTASPSPAATEKKKQKMQEFFTPTAMTGKKIKLNENSPAKTVKKRIKQVAIKEGSVPAALKKVTQEAIKAGVDRTQFFLASESITPEEQKEWERVGDRLQRREDKVIARGMGVTSNMKLPHMQLQSKTFRTLPRSIHRRHAFILGKWALFQSDIAKGKLIPVNVLTNKKSKNTAKLTVNLQHMLFAKAPRMKSITLNPEERQFLQHFYGKSGLKQNARAARFRKVFKPAKAQKQSKTGGKVKTGGKSVRFITPAQAIDRLDLVMAGIDAGDNAVELLNEAVALIDYLRRSGDISKSEAAELYAQVKPHF